MCWYHGVSGTLKKNSFTSNSAAGRVADVDELESDETDDSLSLDVNAELLALYDAQIESAPSSADAAVCRIDGVRNSGGTG